MITYNELLKYNSNTGVQLKDQKIKVLILSNLINPQISDIVKYFFKFYGYQTDIEIGNYNSILHDSFNFKGADFVIILIDASNIIEYSNVTLESYSASEIMELKNSFTSEVETIFENLKDTKKIIFNKLSYLPFQSSTIKDTKYKKFISEINQFIDSLICKNLKIIDIDPIFAEVSISKSLDLRMYYSSKILYTYDFLFHFIKSIFPLFMEILGNTKKVLIIDCDNTLWSGILGEIGEDGIKCSIKDINGKYFALVQKIILNLALRGVIICICSKNDYEAVEKVFKDKKDMTLQFEHITIFRVNWKSKVENIIDIMNILNLGLDSAVFLDDSDFEINLVKEKLPQVSCFQVPKKLYEYPSLFNQLCELFYRSKTTIEDLNKNKIYQEDSKRTEAKKVFSNLDDYLESLNMIIDVLEPSDFIDRISQLTQKTNQFNLTTKRYTVNEISTFNSSPNWKNYTFNVLDKFGDNGLTGLVMVELTDIAIIDSFMLSCRIIGRNLEYKFLDFIIKDLNNYGISTIRAKYIETIKNTQVKYFYEKIGFHIISENDSEKIYEIKISEFKNSGFNYFRINDGRKS